MAPVMWPVVILRFKASSAAPWSGSSMNPVRGLQISHTHTHTGAGRWEEKHKMLFIQQRARWGADKPSDVSVRVSADLSSSQLLSEIGTNRLLFPALRTVRTRLFKSTFLSHFHLSLLFALQPARDGGFSSQVGPSSTPLRCFALWPQPSVSAKSCGKFPSLFSGVCLTLLKWGQAVSARSWSLFRHKCSEVFCCFFTFILMDNLGDFELLLSPF